jgi:hypothetical protein
MSRGFLRRQTPQQDFKDCLHDVFADVMSAVERGELRKPGTLVAFIMVGARRRVGAYIDAAIAARGRASKFDLDQLVNERKDPEDEAKAEVWPLFLPAGMSLCR